MLNRRYLNSTQLYELYTTNICKIGMYSLKMELSCRCMSKKN